MIILTLMTGRLFNKKWIYPCDIHVIYSVILNIFTSAGIGCVNINLVRFFGSNVRSPTIYRYI